MGDQLLCAFVSAFLKSTFVERLLEGTHVDSTYIVEGFKVNKWGGEEGA